MKHTPEPWFNVEYAGFNILQSTPFYEENANILDADVVGEETARANGNLVAAAPELLTSVNKLIDVIKEAGLGYGGKQHPVVTQALELINKITNKK